MIWHLWNRFFYSWHVGLTLTLSKQEASTAAHFRVKCLPSLFSFCRNHSTAGNNNQRRLDDLLLWNLWDMSDGAWGPHQERRRFCVANGWTGMRDGRGKKPSFGCTITNSPNTLRMTRWRGSSVWSPLSWVNHQPEHLNKSTLVAIRAWSLSVTGKSVLFWKIWVD